MPSGKTFWIFIVSTKGDVVQKLYYYFLGQEDIFINTIIITSKS